MSRSNCYVGDVPYLEVLFAVPAASPGSSGTVVFTSGTYGNNSLTETVQDSAEGPVLYFFLDLPHPPDTIGVASVTIDGQEYTNDFGSYPIPDIGPLCP